MIHFKMMYTTDYSNDHYTHDLLPVKIFTDCYTLTMYCLILQTSFVHTITLEKDTYVFIFTSVLFMLFLCFHFCL